MRPVVPLDATPDGTDPFADASPLSLSAFLPEATEALRQSLATGADPSVRLANLRGAFRLGRQLLVSFPSDSPLGPARRVALLQALASVLDTHPDLDLRGCRLLIGGAPTGIDRLGQLCLHQGEAPQEWAAMLTQVDVAFALRRQAYVQAVKGMEAKVATAAGLLMVYTTPVHLPEPSYRSFLERLAVHAAAAGPVAGGALRPDVSVCVLPPHARHSPQGVPLGRALAGPCEADAATGVVYCLDDLTAAEVYCALSSSLGETAARNARVHAARAAEVAALSGRVRQALRLRRLMRDPALAQRDFESACRRLLERSDDLAHGLDGSSLRIGFANRLAPDGSCIEIAWNFED